LDMDQQERKKHASANPYPMRKAQL